jgi:predicted nucleic acid-binding protein
VVGSRGHASANAGTEGPVSHVEVVTQKHETVSFWDALIVEAAVTGGCEVLYSEDLQYGRWFGALRVVNPFT